MAKSYKEVFLPLKVVTSDELVIARSGLALPYELVRH